jgi:hypothetical protein
MFQAEKLRQGTAILWYLILLVTLDLAGRFKVFNTFQGIKHQTPNIIL